MRRPPVALLALVLLPALASPLSAARVDRGAAFRPTKSEHQFALGAAEDSVTQRGLRAEGAVYLVSVELVEEKGTDDRHALVTHYRTAGDLTILTTVNLTKGSITRTDAVAHLPTALAAEELAQARALAFADPTVLTSLGGNKRGIVVEPIVLRPASEADPLWGHRLVRLLFRDGEDYLHAPTVVVDLTTSKVVLTQPSRESEEVQQ